MLGRGSPAAAREARRDHPGTLAAAPRPARQGHLLECARRLDLSLNTVKRYARAEQPERLRRAPQYRPTLVNPYRDHLRKRRAEDPAVPVQRLLREIRNSATRQLEPARPVHHPGPRRGRPAAPVTPPRGLSRRAVPRCDTGPHTGRARLGYGRARVLLKKHTATASGRGLDLHQLRHSAATHLCDQKSPSS